MKTVLLDTQAFFRVCLQDFAAILLRFDVMGMCNNIFLNFNNAPCPNFSKQDQDDPILAFCICEQPWLGLVWALYNLFAHSILHPVSKICIKKG